MTALIDANVLIAALRVHGVVEEIVLAGKGAWATADPVVDEVWKYRKRWSGPSLDDKVARAVFGEFVEENLVVYDKTTYAGAVREAEALTADLGDVPLIALALSVRNDGVWTFNRRDFAQAAELGRLRILTTAEAAALALSTL